jgi:hypothetical protein
MAHSLLVCCTVVVDVGPDMRHLNSRLETRRNGVDRYGFWLLRHNGGEGDEYGDEMEQAAGFL